MKKAATTPEQSKTVLEFAVMTFEQSKAALEFSDKLREFADAFELPQDFTDSMLVAAKLWAQHKTGLDINEA